MKRGAKTILKREYNRHGSIKKACFAAKTGYAAGAAYIHEISDKGQAKPIGWKKGKIIFSDKDGIHGAKWLDKAFRAQKKLPSRIKRKISAWIKNHRIDYWGLGELRARFFGEDEEPTWEETK